MKAFTAILLVALFAAPAAIAQSPATAPSAAPSATDVLNFALNLEYLEAEYYACASTGSPLPDSVRGGGPASTGCMKANLTGIAQQIAVELASNELAHVELLRAALGSMAVPIPQLNIGSSFAAAADAAFGGMNLTPAFSPYLNNLFFALGAYIFEDVGVTAYAGAIPYVSSTPYIQPAGEILGVEGYHAGILRTYLFESATTETPYNVTVADVADSIAMLRAMLGGGSDQGITSTSGNAVLVPTNSMGLVYARTPAQVIDIVTAGNPAGGLFFPNGLNGAIGGSASG